MIAAMLPFLKTLLAIALLRKGPEDLPRSSALLVLSALMWLVGVLTQITVIEQFDESHFGLEVFSAFIGIICYSAVTIGFSQMPRLTQTITALIGCGALLAVIFAIAYIVVDLIGSQLLMLLVVWSIVLWSIAIKGHIIASTINRHWYLGMAFAVGIFTFQHYVHQLITAP